MWCDDPEGSVVRNRGLMGILEGLMLNINFFSYIEMEINFANKVTGKTLKTL